MGRDELQAREQHWEPKKRGNHAANAKCEAKMRPESEERQDEARQRRQSEKKEKMMMRE